MNEFLDILKDFWSKYKTQIIMGLAIVFLIFFLIKSCDTNFKNKSIYDNNIKALTEQMETWKTKAGDLVAEKTVLQGDIKLLKQTNEELYNQVEKLKVKPKEVIYVETEIINNVHDTTYVVDSTYIKKNFDFSDKWRTLSGYIEYNKPNLGLTIDKDITKADFTIAIKDSKVFVTSNNPYIQYNDIQGVVLPKQKPTFSIGVGPSVGFGYGFINKKPDFYVGLGISINYNLLTF